MTSKHLGSCLCGEVRFEISGDFDNFFLCHCSRCRKDTGSAHAANLFSSTAKLAWLAGQDWVRTFKARNTQHQRSFCAQCGSALPGLQMNETALVVPAGSLDGAVGMKPGAHIFFGSRADWDEHLEDLPHLDGLPD